MWVCLYRNVNTYMHKNEDKSNKNKYKYNHR